jgi:thiamine transport system permease protein
MKNNKHPSRIWLVALPILFLAVFYFYPVLKIFSLSFMPEGRWDPGKLHKLVSGTFYIRTFWFTFWQAALSTLLTLLLALPGAYVFARYRFFGKNLLQSFTTVPFVLPTVVVAAAFQALLGPHGLVNTWLVAWFDMPYAPIRLNHTIWFILLAHVFYNYTVVLRIVGTFWSRLECTIAESAQLLGASPWQTFYKITLPLLAPAIFAAGLLVFIFCFSSFGIILILGGPRFATIEVEIYRQAVYLFNLPMAAALSMIQIVFTFVLMWVYTALQRKAAVALMPESSARSLRKVTTCRDRIIVGGTAALMMLLLGMPLLALVFRSFSSDNGFSLVFYRALFENPIQSIFFVPPMEAVIYSVGFAGVTLVLAIFLGLPAASFLALPQRRLGALLDPIFMLPLSTSAVTLGFGFIIALDRPPLNLRTSLLLVPLAHTLVAFPFVVRSLLPALRSIPVSLREAAVMLGASPLKVWQAVDLPIVGRAVLVGAVFAFTVSLGEFGATVFVARPQTPTMPLAIYRFLGQPGAMNYGQAMAMSSILMMVTAVGFLLLEKVKIGNIGEF